MVDRYPPLPNLDNVDLRLLRIFMAVVRNEGFSAAQIELNINQPTISTHMGQLETRLGVTLCHRGRRGFELTKEGELVYDAAQRLFASLELFRGEIGSARGQLVGEIHIGVVDAVVTNPDLKISEVLGAFSREAENIEIVVYVKTPRMLQRDLLEERLHVAIAPFPNLPPKFQIRQLVQEQQILCCSKQHPLFSTNPEKLHIEMLSGLKFVERNYQTWPQELAPHIKVGAKTGSMEAIAMLINTGEFLGYLPAHYAAQWIEKDQMRPLLVDELSYRSQFILAYRGNESNIGAKKLIQHIEATFSTKKKQPAANRRTPRG